MADAARLTAVLDWIGEHPEQHDQRFFRKDSPSCGTTECFAGVAIHLFAPPGVKWTMDVPDGDGVLGYEITVPGMGHETSAPDYAMDLLGLTWPEREALFYNMGGHSSLTQVVERILAGKIVDD